MTPADFRHGFRIEGTCAGERRLADAAAAFTAYCRCDSRARVERESYLSAYQFADDFAHHMRTHGTPKGFAGPTWTRWLWFDLDREDPADALDDCRTLLEHLAGLDVPDGGVLVFFSGSKGFHIGLHTGMWHPEPGDAFHKTARAFAERLAADAGVPVDTGVYDRVRAFRAPNSRHPKTGCHKRRLTLADVDTLDLAAIRDMAQTPEPFEPPDGAGDCWRLAELWQRAQAEVADRTAAMRTRREPGNGPDALNRATLDLIRDGTAVPVGDRHRTLFAAAANLAEFGCPARLAHALLTDSALDTGLPPGEVKRQIDCGLSHTKDKT